MSVKMLPVRKVALAAAMIAAVLLGCTLPPAAPPGAAQPLDPAAFETELDVTPKTIRECGLSSLSYSGPDPELSLGSGVTARMLLARNLLFWCRMHGPMGPAGAPLALEVEIVGRGVWLEALQARFIGPRGPATAETKYAEVITAYPYNIRKTQNIPHSFLFAGAERLVVNVRRAFGHGGQLLDARGLFARACGPRWRRPDVANPDADPTIQAYRALPVTPQVDEAFLESEVEIYAADAIARASPGSAPDDGSMISKGHVALVRMGAPKDGRIVEVPITQEHFQTQTQSCPMVTVAVEPHGASAEMLSLYERFAEVERKLIIGKGQDRIQTPRDYPHACTRRIIGRPIPKADRVWVGVGGDIWRDERADPLQMFAGFAVGELDSFSAAYAYGDSHGWIIRGVQRESCSTWAMH